MRAAIQDFRGSELTLAEWLRELDACSEAVERIEKVGFKATLADAKRAWEGCPRGDWSIWLAGELGLYRWCAIAAASIAREEALQYCDERTRSPSLAAIEAAERCNANPTPDNQAAAMAAEAAARAAEGWASAAAWAVRAAAWAVRAAAWAARAAEAAAMAARWAAGTAEAAAEAAEAAEGAAELARSHRRCARIVTATIPWAEVEQALRAKGLR